MSATKAFAVKGTTNDVTACDLCGREELKGTIVLEILDADANGTGDVVYYGASCGAKAAGWTQREIKSQAKAADTAKRDAERAVREAESDRYCAERDAWCMRKYGVDIWSVRDENGKRRSSVSMVTEFDAEMNTIYA